MDQWKALQNLVVEEVLAHLMASPRHLAPSHEMPLQFLTVIYTCSLHNLNDLDPKQFLTVQTQFIHSLIVPVKFCDWVAEFINCGFIAFSLNTKILRFPSIPVIYFENWLLPSPIGIIEPDDIYNIHKILQLSHILDWYCIIFKSQIFLLLTIRSPRLLCESIIKIICYICIYIFYSLHVNKLYSVDSTVWIMCLNHIDNNFDYHLYQSKILQLLEFDSYLIHLIELTYSNIKLLELITLIAGTWSTFDPNFTWESFLLPTLALLKLSQ